MYAPRGVHTIGLIKPANLQKYSLWLDSLCHSSSMPDSTVTELFRSQSRRVRNFLRRRLHSDEDAQDAAQDVFLNLLRSERAGVLKGDARRYMTRAVHNVAIDVKRWRAYHRPDDRVTLQEDTAL